MNEFYFGIDIGGTFLKAGVINDKNEIILSTKIETATFKKNPNTAEELFKIIKTLSEKLNLKISNAKGIGICLTGLIDSKNGIVNQSIIINGYNYPLVQELEKLSRIPVKIANDADSAVLAEQHIGAGANCKDFIMLTLGTGIGGGIVIDGQNLGINNSKPLEIGHLKISDKKIKCFCGSTGCYELLASTKSLVSQMKEALKKCPSNEILITHSLDEIDGKIIFDYINNNLVKKVLTQFIKNVAAGIINLINIFKPELIIIGGAISEQYDDFIKPLEDYVNQHTFLKFMGYKAKIIPAKLTGNAGLLGTKFLFN